MKLEVKNTNTHVIASDEEEAWLCRYLSFEDSQAHFKYGGGRNKPTVLYNQFSKTFPTGLLALVKKAGPVQGFDIDITDTRARPTLAASDDKLRETAGHWLFDFQWKAIEKVVKNKRGILWIPTGGGKTEIACALSNTVPGPWLFVSHRNELSENAAERYERRTGQKAGRFSGGVVDDPAAEFITATFQSLHSNFGSVATQALLRSVVGVIVDEAHTLPAQTFYRVVAACKNAYYRVGLSGTPLARGDNRSTLAVAALGPVIYRVMPQTLIEMGLLAKPKIKMVNVSHPAEFPTENFTEAYNGLIVHSELRNDIIVEVVKKAAKPCLVFTKSVGHARSLSKRLSHEVDYTEMVNGKVAVKRRLAVIEKARRGEIPIIVSTVVFQEGIDIPNLKSVVIAAGGSSAIAAIQRLGRGMRASAGKHDFELWDFYDQGGHQNPSSKNPRGWMELHSRKRARAYWLEGHEILHGGIDASFETMKFRGPRNA